MSITLSGSRTWAALLFLFVVSGVQAQVYNEILGRPTDTAITISILFDQSGQEEVYWEYGTAPGVYAAQSTTFVTAPNATPLEADLVGLMPDTRYYYRMRHRIYGSSSSFLSGPERTFHTQRAPGSAYTFTVEADEHLYDKKGVASLYAICLDNQAADDPDFMLSLGDIFGDDHGPDTITSAWLDVLHKNYRPYLGAVCHSIPFYVCLGNHEGENDFYLSQTPPNNMAVNGTLWRKFYYPNPYPNGFYTGNTDNEPFGIGAPENYYAWTWGDALFVVLDVYRDQCDTTATPGGWNWSLGWPQYSWLQNTLEGSTAAHKFVFAHHIRGWGRGGITEATDFEWGGYSGNGGAWGFTNKRPGWDKPIHQLFVDNGVDIFFQGHDHLFAHEVLDGVTYQEVPMACDSTYRIGMLANADAYTADTVEGSGHLRVTVDADCITVDFVRAYLPADTVSGVHHNREVAFSYSLGNCVNGLNELEEGVEAVLFPNPATCKVYVRTPVSEADPRLDLFNVMGELLQETRARVLDVEHLPEGVYLLRIGTQGSSITKRLVVQH